jgi:hypothetical protein
MPAGIYFGKGGENRGLFLLRRTAMKAEKTLVIVKSNPNEKGIDFSKSLTGNERVSLVEDLRREMTKVRHHAYPHRLRRVLEISKRRER